MTNKKPVKETKLTTSLFKRFFAFVIDTWILGIFGLLLSIPYSDVFFALGFNGWWIGFIISLLYYSLSQTAKFEGQTIGARILKIATISTNGNYLTLKSALIRNTLLLIIFYNSGILALIPYSHMNILIFCQTIFFSYIAAFFVYLLFNTKHRGIHDLASESIVVNKKAYETLSVKGKKELNKTYVSGRNPLRISAVLIALIIIASIVITIINPIKNTFFGDFYKLSTTIENKTGLKLPSVMERIGIDQKGNHSNAIVVTVSVDRDTFMDTDKLKSLDKKIKKLVTANYHDLEGINEIDVVFNSGYSIGIWTFNENISGDPTTLKH